MSGSKFAWSIPAGALGGATTLTPSILDQSSFSTAGQSELGAAAGYFLQLRPKGTVFLVPITVTFGVDATVAVPSGYTVKVFKLDDTTNTWVEVAGSSYDPVDGSVSVDMSSFSIYGTFVVLDPASSVVSKKGQADSTVVVAIVLAVVLSVLLIVAAMWAVAYYKNKELHRGAAPEVYNPATTAV
jgi:hypothetical protein